MIQMKKTTFTSFTVLCLLSTVFLLGLSFNIDSVKADYTWTETIYIRADGSIEPSTAPVSTVDNVTYTLTDNIVGDVPKDSSAVVVERDSIVIDGAGYAVQGTEERNSKGIDFFWRNNVTLKNVEVRNFYDGIHLYFSSNNTLTGNTASNNRYGISLGASSNNVLSGNTASSNQYHGIYLSSSSNNTLTGNTASNNEHGISIGGSSNVITHNTATHNRYNFGVAGPTLNYIDTSNTVDGKPVYYLVGLADAVYDAKANAGTMYLINCNNITLKDLTLTKNTYGAVLWNTTDSNIENVTASNNEHGIWLSESSNNTISGNTITDNEDQIYLYDSDNCLIDGNTVSNNGSGFGIQLQFLEDCAVTGNVANNNWGGIYLSLAENCSINRNKANNNTYSGIWLSGSEYSRLSNNTVMGNGIIQTWHGGCGILVTSSSYNLITDNSIVNNLRGIRLMYSSDNIVFHNNLIDNTIQVYKGMESNNIWDDGYPAGGNYWGDYNGTDLYSGSSQNLTGSDRIGDVPYTIDADSQDNYPLMSPWGDMEPPVAEAGSNQSVFQGITVLFDASASTDDVAIKRYVWAFTDVTPKTLTGIRPNYTFNNLGDFEVTLNVTDYAGKWDTDTVRITVLVREYWTVDDDGPADFHTIQDAIDAASEGHTIFVHEGVYHEHAYPNYDVYIDKSISLIGENKSTTVIDGQGTGIVVHILEDEVTISGFTIQNSGSGGFDLYRDSAIMIWSDGNSIFGNNIMNNEIGIYILDHGYNMVTGNDITDNYQGIKIWGFYEHPTNNTIYHNNLVNNTEQVRSDDATNAWDNGYPSGGNYWSDYEGADSDGDGVGDSSYEIDADNQDNYPLMGVFCDFSATIEHHVQTICNSTISGFQFNGTAISFSVTGEDGTVGFCRTCIPTTLLNDAYRVFVNGTEVAHTLLPCSNSTHSYLYFTYTHSTQDVVIIPEFPSILIVPLLMALTLGVAVLLRKRRLYVKDS